MNKYTEQDLAAIKEEILGRKAGKYQAIEASIGDAFNLQNLENEIARIETESYIDQNVLDAQFYSDLVPVDYTVNAVEGTSIVKNFTDSVGKGKAISGKGRDAPLVEVINGSQSLPVSRGGIAYNLSTAELQSAAFHNIPLSNQKVAAARLGYEEHIHDIALIGDVDIGTKGLLNHDIPDVVSASASWDAGDVEAILSDIASAMSIAYRDSRNTGRKSKLPNTVLLPSEIWSLLSSKRVGANSERTLLSFIKEHNPLTEAGVPDVKFEQLSELNTLGSDGGRRIVVYRRDKNALELILPQDLLFMPPQADGYDIVNYGHYLYTAVWIKSKNAVTYLDGV